MLYRISTVVRRWLWLLLSSKAKANKDLYHPTRHRQYTKSNQHKLTLGTDRHRLCELRQPAEQLHAPCTETAVHWQSQL